MALGFGIDVGALSSGRTSTYTSQDWIPPPPQGEEANYTTEANEKTAVNGETTPVEVRSVTVPVVPAMANEAIDADTVNAFGPDPFDQYGCPILSPQDMETLSTFPYREMSAQTVAEGELPPLPEGYDVMPLASPSGVFVETEDTFRFRAISTSNNVPVSFFGRVQRPSGYIIPFHHTVNTSTANTAYSVSPVPGLGILLGAAASVPLGSISEGSVSVSGEIGRLQGGAFLPHTLLFSGQLDDLTPLTTTGGGLPPSENRPTYHNASDASLVIAPKTMLITPQPGRRMRFIRVAFTVVTSTAAGERSVLLHFQIKGVSYFTATFNGTVGPNCAPNCYAVLGSGAGVSFMDGTSGGRPLYASIPESLYFYEPVTLSMTYDNAMASDQVRSALVRWEES